MSIGDVILALIVVAIVFFAVRRSSSRSPSAAAAIAHIAAAAVITQRLRTRKSKHLSKTVPLCGAVFALRSHSQTGLRRQSLLRCARTAQAVCPFRAESFAVNHDGECRYARRAHKRVDNLRFSTLL